MGARERNVCGASCAASSAAGTKFSWPLLARDMISEALVGDADGDNILFVWAEVAEVAELESRCN